MGKRRLLKQNKIFISIIAVLFILFGFTLYFGSNQIYEKEAQWQHGNTVARLLSGKEIIEKYFAEFRHNLFFLRDLPSTIGSVDSNFESTPYKNETAEIFHSFAKAFRQYAQIGIINSSGWEILRVDNKHDGTSLIVSDSNLKNKEYQNYFQETIQLDKDRIYASPIHLNLEQRNADTSNVPIVRLATPLFNSKNEKKGILTLDLYISKVLKLLPENMFIQTEEGNILSLKPDGTINFYKSNYVFQDSSGWLHLSEVETIHYSNVEFLPGRRFVIAIHHSHPMLKAALQKLMLLSVILLASFLCLILIIGYLNVVRFRELIGAQKAIIFSLVELTERRDPETGRHLERTKNYTVALTEQLRRNKKYRKRITTEFIEDISDAAPLHDVGKVGIRDSILLKESKLTREEYEEMKEHVRIGKQVLQDAIDKFKLKQPFLFLGRNICAYHHEKYDGKGYLEGLKGQEIPLEARIFALCDVYDAIRSKRSYKGALTHEEAVERIKSDSGKQFDPDIVDAFLKTEKKFAQICNTK
ncbi:MAG: HD domain-containing protein [Planctomycetes bacterium]|uniref:HD domain-containing phosphohydrolase n=1 Tax=Candidatus Wunengus sp. YC65 TaxID=3367701 RepID=UPI001DFC5B1D|nr:HD domain-containing protein [Planctomycetota bacterium]MBI5797040.1 HD domain-containing protein [Planctomycetota bacterium]